MPSNLLHDNIVRIDVVFPHISYSLKCADLFFHKGSKLSIILENFILLTRWINSIEEISCPTLSKPRNGKKNGSYFTYQVVVNFSCNKGFTLRVSQQRICQANKSWTGERTTCSSKGG